MHSGGNLCAARYRSHLSGSVAGICISITAGNLLEGEMICTCLTVVMCESGLSQHFPFFIPRCSKISLFILVLISGNIINRKLLKNPFCNKHTDPSKIPIMMKQELKRLISNNLKRIPLFAAFPSSCMIMHIDLGLTGAFSKCKIISLIYLVTDRLSIR